MKDSPVAVSSTAQARFTTSSDSIVRDKETKCRRAPVSCPRECGAVFEADELEAHWLCCPKVEDDPSLTVSCLHLELGCSYKGRRGQVMRHLKNDCLFEPVKDVLRGHAHELRQMRTTFIRNEAELSRLRKSVE